MAPPPPRDGGQVAQYPQAPALPQFPQIPVAAATTKPHFPTMVTPTPQKPHRHSGFVNAEGNPFSRLPYMSAQFPHPPQYPGHQSAHDMSALMAQLNVMQQLPQYSYQLPGLPPFSFVPGFFQPTAPPTPPATTTTIITHPPVSHDGQHLQQLHQFPAFPYQYQFLPFRGPLPLEGQAGDSQRPKPLHPQMFHIPMLPHLPTLATPTSAPPIKHAPQRPPFNPYPYMPYYVPQQAFMPQFPGKPALPQQHGQQPVNHVPPQFYPSGY